MAKPTKTPLKYRILFLIGKILKAETHILIDQPDMHWRVCFTKVRREL